MATKFKGLTIEIGATTKGLKAALKDVNQKSRDIGKELGEVNRLLKFNPKNTEILSQKQKLLGEQIKNTKEKLEKLKDAQEKAAEKFKNGELGEESYRELRREIVKTESQLEHYQDELKNAGDAHDKLGEKIDNVKNKLQKAGEKMKDVGEKMSMRLTAPIMLAGGAAVRQATTYGDSFAKLSTIADSAAVPLDDLKSDILNLSRETGQAADELNEAAYQAISASVPTADAVSFVNTAVKAAKGGFTDTTTAVDGLTTVLNSYGKAASEADVIANQMLVTQNMGKTTFGELASSMGKISPVASALGVETDSLLSSIAATTAQGLATSESVTALKGAMSNIIKPTKQAADAAYVLGIDFSASALESKGWIGMLQEIRTSMEKTSPKYLELADRNELLQNKLKEMRESGEEGTEMYKEYTGALLETQQEQWNLANMQESQVGAYSQLFGSVEGLNAVLMLTSETGMQKYNETMQEMATNQTALQDAYNTMDEAPGQKMQKALNDLNVTAIEIGDILLPVVLSIAEKFRELVRSFSSLSPEAQKTIIAVAAVAAAIGPLLIVLGTLTSAAGTVAGAFGAGGALSTALTALTGPIGIAVAAIAGISAAFIALYQHNENFRDKVNKLWEKIQGIISKTTENIKIIIEKFVELAKGIWERYGEAITRNTKATFEIILGIIDVVITTIAGIIEVFAKLMQGDWDGAFEALKNTASDVWESIKGIFSSALEILLGLVTGILEGIQKVFSAVWKAIEKKTSEIWKAIKTTISDTIENIKTGVSEKYEEIKTFISDTWDNVLTKTSEIWEEAKKTVVDTIEGIKTGVSEKYEEIKTTISDAWDSILTKTSEIWESIKKTVSDFIESVKTSVSEKYAEIQTSISDTWGNILTNTSKIIEDIKTAVSEKFEEIKDGITKPFKEAYDFVDEKIKAIKDFFTNIELKFPKIEMPELPHFSIEGEFSINPPSVPHLEVDWHAKGGIFTAPTLLAGAGGGLHGVGEAGAEAIMPIENLKYYIADAMEARDKQMSYGLDFIARAITLMDDGLEAKFYNALENAQQKFDMRQLRRGLRA